MSAIAGRTVMVTGASRGIGLELTRLLASAGATVVAVARRFDHPYFQADPAGVTCWTADLSDHRQVDELIVRTGHAFPRLSILINNAAIQTNAKLGEELELRARLRREVALNLDAVVALSSGLLPGLAQQPQAAILNVSSGLAIAPKASAPVYCATKAAVLTYSRALRYQCEQSCPNVSVTAVILPLVETDMTAGRGGRKLTATQAAGAILAAVDKGKVEVFVGQARLLPLLMRVSPSAAFRALRGV